VLAMIKHFKKQRLLSTMLVVRLLMRVRSVLTAQPNIVNIEFQNRLTIVGDLHGQLDDLLTIFELNGMPAQHNVYLFNGDFVDRGQNSCEVVLVLFALKVACPDFVFLNRGNHEARHMNEHDGFMQECLIKYDIDVFDLFCEVFCHIPLGSIVSLQKSKVLVVHGGISAKVHILLFHFILKFQFFSPC
jgi:hypothetical protein